MNPTDVALKNHRVIAEFLDNTTNYDCEISASMKATIAQYILNFRIEINRKAKSLGQDWLLYTDILDAQVSELRRCILDLEIIKGILINGVTEQ